MPAPEAVVDPRGSREAARLRSLARLALLDTPREERFDRIARTAQRLLRVPLALITLLDSERLWVKAAAGGPATETPREDSFCTHAVDSGRLLEVPDPRSDVRFAGNPHVAGEGGVGFYAGMPLAAPDGEHVGTLCIFDREPRTLSPEERQVLADLAAWVELELRMAEVERLTHELEQTRRWTSMVVNSAAEAIVALDRAGVVTTANPVTTTLTGWPVEELVGRSFLDTVMCRDAEGAPVDVDTHPVSRALSAGVVAASLDGVLRHRDGSAVPVLWSVSPIEEDGAIAGAVVVAADASARHEVDRMKDEFVSLVSHELRTPLTAIRGSLSLLSAGVLGDLPPAAVEVAEVATRNTDRLVRLVNDILDLERLRAGRMQLHHQEVDLLMLARQSVQNVVSTTGAGTDGVAPVVTGEPTPAWVDPDRVVQALTNLLGNAVKFTPPTGTVTVFVGRQGDRALVQVADTGRGIPADRLDRVFDRFEQVDAGDARLRGGTGLGLAITRHIVEAHGGEITVRSRPGVGSTFSVLLPLSPAPGTRS